jgi:CRISPR-associated protein Csb1
MAGLDRFQPAGFPEIGHVIYKAPRKNGAVEHVCIVDSAASMANHLESVCMRGAHDYDLAADLNGMPYLRCVTRPQPPDGDQLNRKEVVVTSLTEGHRIASTYFLGARNKKTRKWDGKGGQRVLPKGLSATSFGDELAEAFGIVPAPDSKVAHPPVEKWWQVFSTVFRYDPNALVHGVLFPQWNVKISRVLTAHLEAFGAGRVDRSGVKFDRLQKTTSKQPIFAVDDSTAREIRATFILDVALLRSFGRVNGQETLGLTATQKEFLVALALWKIRALLSAPFRFRSGCHLQLVSLKQGDNDVVIDVDIATAIKTAAFRTGKDAGDPVTDIFWPREDLYQEPPEEESAAKGGQEEEEDGEETEAE